MLVHWNNIPHLDMSAHSDTLSFFRAYQSLLFLLNATCLAEKQQIPILQFLVWSDRDSNLRSTTLEASMLTITHQLLSPLMLWVRISIRARCTTLCDKICQWLATGRWFSPGPSTNKTDRYNITEILLKVSLNTNKHQTKNQIYIFSGFKY